MARDYTNEELNEAIAKLVRQSIRREYGALGNRKTGTTFSDVQDAAAGVFVLKANAPFYVVRLGADLIDDIVETTENSLTDLIDTVRATNRRVKPVESISSLANARSALRALGGASAVRDTSLARIDDVPAFRRFDQSTARFLSESGKEVRSGGAVVQTPQEARGRLAGVVSELQASHEEIIRRTQLLVGAIADYDEMRLPSKFSNAVIQSSLAVVENRFDQLDALTPEERLGVLRGVVLDVLAARSAVRGFGSLEPTRTFTYFEGTGGPYADATHPATPATVLSDIGEPYTVLGVQSLDFLMDGATSFSTDVPESYTASVEGFILEPYDISSATPGEENNQLYVAVTQWALLSVPLTTGVGRTVQEIADDINVVVGFRPIVAEPYGPQLYLQGEPVEMNATGLTVTFTRTAGTDWPDSGQFAVALGDWIEVTTAVDPDNLGWYTVSNIAGLPTSFDALKELTPAPPADEFGGTAVVSLNKGGRALRIRFQDTYLQNAVDGRESIGVPTRLLPTEAVNPIVARTQNTLGLPHDSTFQCEGTRAADVATFINDNPIIAPGGVGTVRATTELGSVFWDDSLRSDPFDSTKVILSKLQASGVIAAFSFTGPLGTITLESLSSDPTVAGAQAGDQLVIRGLVSATPTLKDDQVGLFGTISSVTSTQIVVDIVFGATGVDLGDQWTVEVGPNLSSEKLPLTLVVDEGQMNQGTYAVGFLGGVDETGPSFELGLERPLIQYTNLGSQSHSFTGQVGRRHVRFTTQSTLLDSAIQIEASSSAGALFFTSMPTGNVGETSWFSLPTAPKSLEEGDYLELHDDPVATPTYSIEIERVGTAPNLLGLVVTLPVDVGPWNLRQDVQTPYGKVRKRKKDNYSLLQANLEAWLAESENSTTRYYRELRRLINPLIVNKNPRASDVNTAVLHLQGLEAKFTSLRVYLSMYTAPLVEEVGVLLDSYMAQGAQRAVDILLEARFSDFFGLSQDEASYSGNVQKAIRDVNIRDLPQRRIGRSPGGEVIEEYEEVDYEYNLDDVEDEEIPTPGDVSEFVDSSF